MWNPQLGYQTHILFSVNKFNWKYVHSPQTLFGFRKPHLSCVSCVLNETQSCTALINCTWWPYYGCSFSKKISLKVFLTNNSEIFFAFITKITIFIQFWGIWIKMFKFHIFFWMYLQFLCSTNEKDLVNAWKNSQFGFEN